MALPVGLNDCPSERKARNMKTNATVLWDRHQMWEVEEVELDGPKHAVVMVQLVASGLCHPDDHIVIPEGVGHCQGRFELFRSRCKQR